MALFATARMLLINSNKELLVVRRSATDPRHAGKWDVPGGRLDVDEDVRAAAIRECEEEVGITPKGPQLVFGVSAPRPDGTGTWIFFLERITGDNPAVTLSYEHDEYKWVPFAELPTYVGFKVLLDMHKFLAGQHII